MSHNYEFKSTIELYFSYYLEELQDNGYIDWWGYESSTYDLSESVSLPYKQYLKSGKIKDKLEHVMHKASITADFTIEWLEKAKNVFYLDVNEPIDYMSSVRDIPFRVNGNLVSEVEIKGSSERTTSSSVSFPYKQKWCYQLYKVYIQKIKPIHPTKGLLFGDTFTPKKVIKEEVYKRDCKWGKKGESKLKYEIKTLDEFIKNNT